MNMRLDSSTLDRLVRIAAQETALGARSGPARHREERQKRDVAIQIGGRPTSFGLLRRFTPRNDADPRGNDVAHAKSRASKRLLNAYKR
jgi:hypothetical protein